MRVLAVCLGNICRSPAAEAAIAEAASRAGMSVEVDSAGTGAYHVGEPPDRRMRAAASRAGLEIDGRARQFQPDDFDRFDLIVVMDRSNLRDVVARAPDDRAAEKVRLFRTFDPQADPADLDVPDPYYGGDDGFRDVVAMVRRAAAGLIDEIER
ncbi:MAG TPA: low molecular weight protein-tyrosine-phosphatase [Acidimicrobiia bacterium]|jgi:protein-tyrosine phosphatase